MRREELQALTIEMLGFATPENQARMSEILTLIEDDNESSLSQVQRLTESNNSLTERNEHLREVNTELFLKTHSKGTQGGAPDEPPKTDPENELTFEKLFNDKGELL